MSRLSGSARTFDAWAYAQVPPSSQRNSLPADYVVRAERLRHAHGRLDARSDASHSRSVCCLFARSCCSGTTVANGGRSLVSGFIAILVRSSNTHRLSACARVRPKLPQVPYLNRGGKFNFFRLLLVL